LSSPLVEIRDVSRSFGKVQAVYRLSFSFEAGEIYGFIGPNGAGKTTTMRILATLDLPDSGDAFVGGLSVLVEPRKVRMKVGFMPDQFVPYPNLDVMQYLDFFARAYGLRGVERLSTVRSVASFCGLEGFRDRPATGLSKGMGQRLHLAKTLLHDPELLILDEPASGLDPRARIEFRELLRELAANGKGILISSHILSELSETCDGVVVIERGRKVVAGDIESIARGVKQHHAMTVRVLGEVERTQQFFLLQPHVQNVSVLDGHVSFDFTGDHDALADLLSRAVGEGLRVVDFHQREADLEDIFMRTTEGHLQ
jgi:ABC-2 type transport system ATP-binding protein